MMERGSIIDAQITLEEEKEKIRNEWIIQSANYFQGLRDYKIRRKEKTQEIIDELKDKEMQIKPLERPFINMGLLP